MLSNRQRKKLRKHKTCLSKRGYRSLTEAKVADPSRFPYRCPVCYAWHNASVPNNTELDMIMREYK